MKDLHAECLQRLQYLNDKIYWDVKNLDPKLPKFELLFLVKKQKQMKEQLATDLHNCEEKMKDMHLQIKRRLKTKKKKIGLQTPINKELKSSIIKLLAKDRVSTSSAFETPKSNRGAFISLTKDPILKIDQEHMYSSFNQTSIELSQVLPKNRDLIRSNDSHKSPIYSRGMN